MTFCWYSVTTINNNAELWINPWSSWSDPTEIGVVFYHTK